MLEDAGSSEAASRTDDVRFAAPDLLDTGAVAPDAARLMGSRLVAKLRRSVEKPPRVLLVRGLQEARLIAMERTRAWARVAARHRRRFAGGRAAALLAATPTVLAPDWPAAVARAAADGLLDLDPTRRAAEAVVRGEVTVFGALVPTAGGWPWHADWRVGHVFPPRDFRAYDHHAARDRPYDVKFPWELSRLAFLQPLLLAAAADRAPRYRQAAVAVLEDWERANPLARSVAWYPMEASMRGLGLVVLLDLLRAVPGATAADAGLLGRLIADHGAFVWRTVEDADIRGNHFTANLAGLLAIGAALDGSHPQARHWFDYAAERIEPEILLQFTEDGVNFEKAVGYHRLVTELFLVAAAILARRGRPLGTAAEARLAAAAHYSAAVMRPDGLAANIGDGDDAFVLDPTVPVRDHRPLIGWAAALFGDSALKAAAGTMPVLVPLLEGEAGVAAWTGLRPAPAPGSRHFGQGGMVVVRDGGNHLVVDVGEVGLAGRGGHGHNDILSFELSLGGRPLVVDPGTYLYTGDPAARAWFRGTAAHNGLMVDGAEIARFLAPFRTADDARALDVDVAIQGARAEIAAGHTGYHQLADPVDHRREIAADMAAGTLACTDRLTCAGPHTVERFLHLAPGVEVALDGAGARLTRDGRVWVCAWPDGAEARVEPGMVSDRFGQRAEAPVVVLRNAIAGPTELRFSIAPAPQDHP